MIFLSVGENLSLLADKHQIVTFSLDFGSPESIQKSVVEITVKLVPHLSRSAHKISGQPALFVDLEEKMQGKSVFPWLVTSAQLSLLSDVIHQR